MTAGVVWRNTTEPNKTVVWLVTWYAGTKRDGATDPDSHIVDAKGDGTCDQGNYMVGIGITRGFLAPAIYIINDTNSCMVGIKKDGTSDTDSWMFGINVDGTIDTDSCIVGTNVNAWYQYTDTCMTSTKVDGTSARDSCHCWYQCQWYQ